MTDSERSKALSELLEIREQDDGTLTDGGLLDRIPMKIIPLRGSQRKGASRT
ncbi:hypothetical protein HGG76_11795 [Ochrobactrum tritici]|uniref:Uncharacterized protein n=1 Tax=Brucella tritici TaxID=94626 RepID=A0A7X6FRX5_9HYPH|nr:hypothetical protein [Brucella tritici]